MALAGFQDWTVCLEKRVKKVIPVRKVNAEPLDLQVEMAAPEYREYRDPLDLQDLRR